MGQAPEAIDMPSEYADHVGTVGDNGGGIEFSSNDEFHCPWDFDYESLSQYRDGRRLSQCMIFRLNGSYHSQMLYPGAVYPFPNDAEEDKRLKLMDFVIRNFVGTRRIFVPDNIQVANVGRSIPFSMGWFVQPISDVGRDFG